MPCDTFNTSLSLSVSSTSNYVWFDVEKHSAGAIEIDASGAGGGWSVQVLRSARQVGDIGYAMSPDITFSASGISESMDLTGVKRLGVKVTGTGTGSLTIYLIIKADR